MVAVSDEGIILQKTNLSFENKSVLNPTCIQIADITHMFYRAVNTDNISSIGYCQLKNNKVVKRSDSPILFPQYEYEKKGLEDPRISFIDGVYCLFYTVYDGQNALISYATSSDLINFKKMGLISPQISYSMAAKDIFQNFKAGKEYLMFDKFSEEEAGKDILLFEKDACLFPAKFNGRFALLHRVMPGIQIIYFDSFSDLTKNYWIDYLKKMKDFIILNPLYWFENLKIGSGCTPIQTKDGWLIIYHAVEGTKSGEVYHAGAALLDINNPLKVLGRLKEPLFSPQEPWEKEGSVRNVVFPSGAVIVNSRLYIYYGAADTCIGAKSINLNELLSELKKT